MNLRVAGTSASLLLVLVGCGTPEGNPLAPNTLRVEVGDVAWAAYQDGDGPWQPLPIGTATPVMSASQLKTLPADRDGFARPNPLATSRSHPRVQPERAGGQLEPFQAQVHTVAITDLQGRYGLAYVCLGGDPSYGYSDLS